MGRLVQEVDAFAEYDSARLPLLARHLALPPNCQHLSINAMLGLQLRREISPEALSAAEEVLIPVVCALSL